VVKHLELPRLDECSAPPSRHRDLFPEARADEKQSVAADEQNDQHKA